MRKGLVRVNSSHISMLREHEAYDREIRTDVPDDRSRLDVFFHAFIMSPQHKVKCRVQVAQSLQRNSKVRRGNHAIKSGPMEKFTSHQTRPVRLYAVPTAELLRIARPYEKPNIVAKLGGKASQSAR